MPRGRGRPPRITPAKAAFLAAVRQFHSLSYRALATSDYTRWLGLKGVHYTSIHKAIKRLPEDLFEEAIKILAEMTSNSPIIAIVDATIFTLSCHDERMARLKETKVRVTVKLSALWDAKTHVFHGVKVIHGASRATSTFKHLVNGCRVKIEALFADSEFSSRPNVQLCANRGIKAAIKPQKNATPKAKGCPAWSDNVREYKALGYDGWAKKTGYFRKRFSEEHAFGMLIAKYGDEVTSRTTEMAAKDVLSRLMLHNLHAFLYHRALSQKEHA